MAGKVKNYTDDFKKQIVALRESGKTVSSIVKEYGIAKSTVTKWTTDYRKADPSKQKTTELRKKMNASLKKRKQAALNGE